MNPVGVDTGKAKVDVASEGKVRQVKRPRGPTRSQLSSG